MLLSKCCTVLLHSCRDICRCVPCCDTLWHTLYCATDDTFIRLTDSLPRKNVILYSTLLSQDEFRQWFRAKVHVMLAPGRKPFDSLDLQPTTQLPNGDHSISDVPQAHDGNFAHRQPAKVLQWGSCFFHHLLLI